MEITRNVGIRGVGHSTIEVDGYLLNTVNKFLERYTYLNRPKEKAKIESVEELEDLIKYYFNNCGGTNEHFDSTLIDRYGYTDILYMIVQDLIDDLLFEEKLEIDDYNETDFDFEIKY